MDILYTIDMRDMNNILYYHTDKAKKFLFECKNV
jgi:hypothetical protein